ncbi:MAG: hypothetical protein J5608_03155 [Alphaproteobacteria bacterium]|nr:hypothetical protein [Alphaproteobacteria bacterium]
MKKYFVLTSVLALCACGGGGSNPGAPVTPTTPVYSISNADRTANANNANVTGMTSAIVTNDTPATRTATVTLVSNALGEEIFNQHTLTTVSSRAATRARAASVTGTELTDSQKYYIAYKKLEKMEKTLKSLNGAASFETFVNANKADVVEALKLMGQDSINMDSETSALQTAFNTVKGGDLDAAITARLPFSTVKIDAVKFNFAGEDRYAKFQIDNNGDITAVAQFDGETDTIASEGWFARNGNNKTFAKTMKQYTFDFGNTTGIDWFDNIPSGKGDILSLEMITETDADAPSATAMKAAIASEIEKFIAGQHGGTPITDDQKNALIEYFNDVIDSYDMNDAQTSNITYNLTLESLGKDSGLKFSDFGYAKMIENGETKYSPYAGGYQELKASNEIMASLENTTTFKGKAIIGVDADNDGTGVDSSSILLVDNNAQLYFSNTANGKTSKLTMNNLRDTNTENTKRDWYKTTITQDDTGLNMRFDPSGKNIDARYKFATVDSNGVMEHKFTTGWNSTEDRYENVANDNTVLTGRATFDYYSNNPNTDDLAEAGATFHFGENQHWDHDHPGNYTINEGDEVQHELSIYGAFGGKKQ